MTLQEMIDKGPEWLDNYLQEVEAGRVVAGFLIGIESGASSKAHSENSLKWAEIAAKAAELYAVQGTGEHRAAVLHNAMSLRAWFISKLGPLSGHPVLDPEIIVRWFEKETKYSLSTVEEKSARLRATRLSDNDLDELVTLRNIKGRVTVLRVLAHAGALSNHPELQKWLDVRGRII